MHWIRPGQPAGSGLVIACLCADWCLTCKAYETVFEAVAARNPGTAFAWLDVEDDADWAGDIDVENFPTLLIARDGAVRFFGTVTPHEGTLARLVESALRDTLAAGGLEAAVRELATRLCAAAVDDEGGALRPA